MSWRRKHPQGPPVGSLYHLARDRPRSGAEAAEPFKLRRALGAWRLAAVGERLVPRNAWPVPRSGRASEPGERLLPRSGSTASPGGRLVPRDARPVPRSGSTAGLCDRRIPRSRRLAPWDGSTAWLGARCTPRDRRLARWNGSTSWLGGRCTPRNRRLARRNGSSSWLGGRSLPGNRRLVPPNGSAAGGLQGSEGPTSKFSTNAHPPSAALPSSTLGFRLFPPQVPLARIFLLPQTWGEVILTRNGGMSMRNLAGNYRVARGAVLAAVFLSFILTASGCRTRSE